MFRSEMICGNCLYFDCFEQCRRRAPNYINLDGEAVAVFPKVPHDCWCGEGLWRREGATKIWGEWMDEEDPFKPPDGTCKP